MSVTRAQMWNMYLYSRSYIFQSCNFRSCIFSPAFSGPPFSTPAFLVFHFRSCIFRSRIFSLAFSASPPNIAILDLFKAISRKRCKIGAKLLLITNRKSHMSFRLVPKSVTLNDLKQRNSPNLCVISPNSVAFGTD